MIDLFLVYYMCTNMNITDMIDKSNIFDVIDLSNITDKYG
jgi:hypothetical protein